MALHRPTFPRGTIGVPGSSPLSPQMSVVTSALPCVTGKTMKGRAFLTVAEELVRGSSEAHWRAAAGRAYYGLLLEGLATLDDWGILNSTRQSVHAFVRLRLTY